MRLSPTLLPLAGLLASCATPQPPAPDPFAGFAQRYRDDCASGQFAGIVRVEQAGRVLFEHVCGLADRAAATPIRLDSRFKIASITKPLTALAVMRLVERRRLDLDESVLTYLPEAPPAWREIRLRHLLQHTSGIPDQIEPLYNAFSGDYGAAFARVLADLRTANAPPATAPGSRFEYSNYNYELAAEIVARAAGKPFDEALRELVFVPAGMRTATLDRPRLAEGRVAGSAAEPDMAIGYEGSAEAPAPGAEYAYVFRGSGSVHAGLADFLAWDRAWSAGRLLSPVAQARLEAETVELQPCYFQALVGLLRDHRGERVWFQWGAMDGFKPYFARVPARRLTVVVLSNLNWVRPNVRGQELLDAALGAPEAAPADSAPPACAA